MEKFSVPILLMTFNRLDTTKIVFAEIKKIKPCKLFVSSDGPRVAKDGENEQVEAVRDFILNNIDWDCEVKTLFRDNNLGCMVADRSAITWFFENVEEGIILEDDCLPHPTFFKFCEELLDRYREDERIMSIGGNNFQNGIKRGDYSYYFSAFTYVWGWATWRRAWQKYDKDLKTLPKFEKNRKINNYFKSFVDRQYWMSNFKDAYDKKIDTWDYAWLYCCFLNSGFTCVPNVNLVKNIGFGHNQATHTTINIDNFVVDMELMNFPLRHPLSMQRNAEADEYYNRKIFRVITRKAYYISILEKLKIYSFLKKIFIFFRKKRKDV